MAAVYRAWDAELQVWRALKVLLPEFADRKGLRERFEREAATMAVLDHGHVIRVYDVVVDEALPFMVMELAEGGTLVGWLEAYGTMPAGLACDVTGQVAQGLGAAHAAGVVHRDVKPHNVLVTTDGRCKVTDFGIARVRSADIGEGMTRTGSTMGTIGYMAPEQRSDAKYVDERADIYGLGAMLYKLLTGIIMTDLFLIEHEPELLDQVPQPLHELILKACFHDRERRYPNTDAFLATLAELRPLLDADPRDTPPLPIPITETPFRPHAADPFPEIAVLLRDPEATEGASTSIHTPDLPPRPTPALEPVMSHDPDPRPQAPETFAAGGYAKPNLHPSLADGPDALVAAATQAEGPPSMPSIEAENLGPPSEAPKSMDGVSEPPRKIAPIYREREASEAPVARRATVILASLALAAWLGLLFVSAYGAYTVRSSAAEAKQARKRLVDVIVREQAVLQELERAGAQPQMIDDLHGLYVAFEGARPGLARIKAAATYVRAVDANSGALLPHASEGSLVRGRVRQMTVSLERYIELRRIWWNRSQQGPGRLATGLGLAPRP